MSKKILVLAVFIICAMVCLQFTYATDAAQDPSIAEATEDSTAAAAASTEPVDNTIYTSNPDQTQDATADATDPTVDEPVTSTVESSDYEDSGDLSITNIINIILIVVGVVLILLGIAIIIRLK